MPKFSAKSHQELIDEWKKNPEFNKAFDDLKEEFDSLQAKLKSQKIRDVSKESCISQNDSPQKSNSRNN